MRLLDVELEEVGQGGPAVRDGRLGDHQSSGQVQVTQRTAQRVSAGRSLSSLLSPRLESEGTLKVVCAERPPSNEPVNPSVRHLISSELESPEGGASLADLPEDRVVSSAANLQHREAGGQGDKAQQSVLLSVTGN